MPSCKVKVSYTFHYIIFFCSSVNVLQLAQSDAICFSLWIFVSNLINVMNIGWWCLMPLSIIYIINYIVASVLLEKIIDLQQVTDKLSCIMYRMQLAWAWFELTTLAVICTDCIGRYKSNYHTITTTTVPCHEYSKQVFVDIQIWSQKRFVQVVEMNIFTITQI